jgi:DNA-binding NtrC family response regulator
VDELYSQLGPDVSGLLFFCAPSFDLKTLGRAIKDKFNCPVAGCTTAGEICSPQGYLENSLVVEDEQDIRDLTREALESYGYKVFTASSGEEALDLFSGMEDGVHMVVLDLNMPGMGGHQCLREFLQRAPELPVLISSGYSAAGLTDTPANAGAAGFIAKPYHLTDLATEVRRVLDRSKDAEDRRVQE